MSIPFQQLVLFFGLRFKSCIFVKEGNKRIEGAKKVTAKEKR